MLTCPSTDKLTGLDLAEAILENAVRQATDPPLPEGAQCSNCEYFVDYSGDGFTRVIAADGSIGYTNQQIGVCLKQMSQGGYKGNCPDCHHQHKRPCHAHRSNRRSYNQCPGWEPNWAWLNCGSAIEF